MTVAGPPRGSTVKECLGIVLKEEFWHRTYAERDFAILESAHPHERASC